MAIQYKEFQIIKLVSEVIGISFLCMQNKDAFYTNLRIDTQTPFYACKLYNEKGNTSNEKK